MANILESGASLVADTLAAHASKTVTLRRGAAEVSVAATIGRSNFEMTRADGSVVSFQSRDFLIKRGAYDFGAGPVEPARGDQIVETIGADTRTYELLDLAGEKAWKFADGFQKMLRVHTKETATA